MAISFRVESISKSAKDKPIAWVSAVDDERVICQIAIPYSEDSTIFKSKIIEKMTPYVRKYRNKLIMKQEAQTIANSINITTEVI